MNEPKSYTISEDGHERGSYTLDEIIAMALSREVDVSRAVYRDAHDRWSPLGKIVNTRLEARKAELRAKAVEGLGPAQTQGSRISALQGGHEEPLSVMILRVLAWLNFAAALVCLAMWRMDAELLWISGFGSTVLWLSLAEGLSLMSKIEFNTRK